MYSQSIINGVNTLLNSHLSPSSISESTHVNLSIIKKLKSNLQTIENTSFGSIIKLYDFYLDNQAKIEAHKNIDPNILSQKLPKSIIKFLDELTYSVNQINHHAVSKLSKVYLYDEYTLNNAGNSTEKKSFIQLEEYLPIIKDGSTYSYHVSIKHNIENKNKIESIKDLKLIFERELLEIDLKKYKFSGAKMKIFKDKNGNTGIRLISNIDNVDIYNFESSYFKLDFKEA